MHITLTFKKPGYIAHPFRTSMFKLIEIQKQSGMMRARSEKKRRECLEAHLRMNDMTMEDFLKLKADAEEPFYKNEEGNIIIPANNVLACLVNANSEAPSRLRIQNLRSALTVSDFTTDKKKPDGIYERFAVVKAGAGQKLSNQRGLRQNPYICDFEATGTIDHDAEMVEAKAIVDLLTYAGRQIGIGASRPMNYGRFSVSVKD